MVEKSEARRILVVDPTPDRYLFEIRSLRDHFGEVDVVTTFDAALKALAQRSYFGTVFDPRPPRLYEHSLAFMDEAKAQGLVRVIHSRYWGPTRLTQGLHYDAAFAVYHYDPQHLIKALEDPSQTLENALIAD